MEEQEILKMLLSIPEEKWKDILAKCYTHIEIKLYGKTSSGSHCEQRLGMNATDYYCGRAIKAVYSGTWEWKYRDYTIEEQLIRIIDSMISEEVRKYKVEIKHSRTTVLIENKQLTLAIEDQSEDEEDKDEYLQKLNKALDLACKDNKIYEQFICLKKKNLNYDEIGKELNCTKNQAYQIMENVSRRAKKILKSL